MSFAASVSALKFSANPNKFGGAVKSALGLYCRANVVEKGKGGGALTVSGSVAAAALAEKSLRLADKAARADLDAVMCFDWLLESDVQKQLVELRQKLDNDQALQAAAGKKRELPASSASSGQPAAKKEKAGMSEVEAAAAMFRGFP